MATIINIAAYQFAALTDLKPLREKLIAQCKKWGLRGTILLSTEGINLFVAGESDSIHLLLAELRAIPGLATLKPKISESAHQPFSRMLVRIKKEIIAFGVEGIDPARRTSPKLQAATLKQWLDEGRPVTLLDTRNDYEVKLGTFKGAIPAGIDHFRDFPKAVSRLPEHLKDQPIVMFCTGGIRCEKAGPYMEREGFKNILQLDGGILKYFEDCGGDHYQGECFVFDQRVGVDPALHETGSDQCFACLTPLTAEEQAHPRFVAGQSCPYCYKTSAERMAENISARHETLRELTTPLPGSLPYDNYRPIIAPHRDAGATVLDFLSQTLSHIPRQEWAAEFEVGRILNADRQPVQATDPVIPGHRYLLWLPGIIEPDVSMDIRILHEDEAIIVLNKPAPLPLHPCGRFNRNSLQHVLHALYHPQRPRPAHRLDANTTGLVVVARTRHFARPIQMEFESGGVEKTYLVRVQGQSTEDHFIVDAPISVEPAELGTRSVDKENGLPAKTEFKVLSRLADGTTLLQARPITGRTNQIRVHLWQRGLPVCGDQAYRPNTTLGDTQTHPLGAPPLCLHAWKLSFTHPLTKQRLAFEAERPSWAQ